MRFRSFACCAPIMHDQRVVLWAHAISASPLSQVSCGTQEPSNGQGVMTPALANKQDNSTRPMIAHGPATRLRVVEAAVASQAAERR